jgi:acyl-CoA dehydrogenase
VMTNSINMYADEMLVDTVNRLFEQHCTPERTKAAERSMDQELWAESYDMGLTTVGVPETLGGSGGTLHDAAAIMTATGYHAAAAPIADSLAAALIAAHCEFSISDVGSDPIVAIAGKRVPWMGVAAHAVTSTGITPTSTVSVASSGLNYAGEPFAIIEPQTNVESARQILALTRSLQIAGALQKVSELCIQYAMEREQFGKPIGKQQILQHYLAQMAGDAATAQAAADNAVDTWAVCGLGAEATFAIAAAKTVCSRLVAGTNKNAHQLHGAIGYTDEHRLQFWTRRLWAWRDDFGTETQWGADLGRSVVSAGGASLWGLVTRLPPAS